MCTLRGAGVCRECAYSGMCPGWLASEGCSAPSSRFRASKPPFDRTLHDPFSRPKRCPAVTKGEVTLMDQKGTLPIVLAGVAIAGVALGAIVRAQPNKRPVVRSNVET